MSDIAHGYDPETGSPVPPTSNWLAQVSPAEAALAALHPLEQRRPPQVPDPEFPWTVADHRGRPGWRIVGSYHRLICHHCRRQLAWIRRPVPDNLVSWPVDDETHLVYRGWQNGDGRLICGTCWAGMPCHAPHILDQQQAELARRVA